MAKSESDDSRYESKYGGGWVTPAQILAELMCERMAGSKKETLPAKFWNIKKWNATFRWQLTEANRLLKKYQPKVVSKAIRSKEGRKFLSLSNPDLKKLIAEEDIKYREEIKSIKPIEQVSEEVKQLPEFKKSVVKRNVMSALEELDNG